MIVKGSEILLNMFITRLKSRGSGFEIYLMSLIHCSALRKAQSIAQSFIRNTLFIGFLQICMESVCEAIKAGSLFAGAFLPVWLL